MANQVLKYVLEGDASGAVNAAKKAKDAVKNATNALNRLRNEASNATGLKNYSKALITVRNSLDKNNPALQTFNKLIAQTKTELKGVSTTNAFDTSTINGLKQYRAELVQQRDAMAKSEAAFASYNKRIEQTSQQLKRLANTGISQVGKSFQGLTVRMDKINTVFARAPFAHAAPQINRFTDALGRTRTNLRGYTAAQSNAGTVLLSFSQGVQDLPYGLIGIQNNLTQVVAQLGYLRTEAGSTRKVIKLLGSAFIGPAGILFAFSAITSIATALTQKYGSLTNGIQHLLGTLTVQKQVQDAVNKSYEEAVKNTSKAANKIILLNEKVKLSKQGFISAKDVVKDYNDKLGDTFGKTNDLIGVETILAKNSDNFIRFTLAKAAAMKILDKAAEAAATTISDSIKPPQEFLGWWDSFKKGTLSFLAYPLSTTNKWLGFNAFYGSQKGFNKFQKSLNNLYLPDAAIDKFNKIGEDINLQESLSSQFDKMMSDLAKKFPDLFNKIGIEGGKSFSDGFNSSFSASKSFRDFINKLGILNKKALDFHWIDSQIITARIDLVKNKMSEFIEQGKTATAEYEKLKNLFNAFIIKPLDVSPIVPGNPNKSINKSIEEGTSKIVYLDAIVKKTQEANKATQNWSQATQTVSGLFEQVFSNIASGENVFDQLANSVQRLVVKLIAAAAAAAVINAITGGAAGGFLSLFGKISGIPSFAGGGFIPGPTLAIVGDAPGGEFVLNQSQMNNLLNSRSAQEVNVTGTFVQRGNDLVAVVERTNNLTNRRNG